MNEKNYDYLKDQVKYTGFGDALEKALLEHMQKGHSEFQIYYNNKFGNDHTTATLHFKKSAQSDMYFFNKYDLTLKQEHNPGLMKQTFYINKASNITLKEAYNLMCGRAIYKDLSTKDGQVYNAWLQMDLKETDKSGNYQLKQYHANYGFSLEKQLAEHPIKELDNEHDKIRLHESLYKGNRQSVTFLKDGKEQQMFIEANPRFKSITVYNSNMQRVHGLSKKQDNTPTQSAKKEVKNQKQKDEGGDSSSDVSKKKARGNKQSLS